MFHMKQHCNEMQRSLNLIMEDPLICLRAAYANISCTKRETYGCRKAGYGHPAE